ncbi:MAG: hypothetical protein ACFE0O_12410 [Opitutales bacterium]
MAAPTLQRFQTNPLIRANEPPSIGGNVNGPSVIRVPDWVANPLGRYYLYFAHHQGDHIRMAYADALEGPWTVHEPGVLALDDTPFHAHIASPDVHIDDANRRIFMLYHGCGNRHPHDSPYPQQTAFASGPDGLTFQADDTLLTESYYRVIRHPDRAGWLGCAGGPYRILYFTDDPARPPCAGPRLDIPGEPLGDPAGKDWRALDAMTRLRHVALDTRPGTLILYYTCCGDTPERIKRVHIALDQDPGAAAWTTSAPEEVARPATDAEGAHLPVEPSRGGSVHAPVHQLRDPEIFHDDGKPYLFYTLAGEHGIGGGALIEA